MMKNLLVKFIYTAKVDPNQSIRREKAGTKKIKNPKAFIDYS